MMLLAAVGDPKYTSLGLSGRAHILVFLVTIGGARVPAAPAAPAPDARQVHAALGDGAARRCS